MRGTDRTMATLTSSPVPRSDLLAQEAEHLEERLDDQILKIRTEIAKLRSQKQKLSTSLLGSAKIQKHVQPRTSRNRGDSTKDKRAIAEADKDNELHARLEAAIANHNHEDTVRLQTLAHGVTAFPWGDTANERRGADDREALMLGVRIDVHPTTAEVLQDSKDTDDSAGAENEQDETPSKYIVLLRKLQHDQKTYLKVDWTNIPKHIDIERYEQTYLPLPDALRDEDEHVQAEEESFRDDSGIDVTQDLEATTVALPVTMARSVTANVTENGQDLHKFVQVVRDDLQSWWYRRQHILHIRSELGLPTSSLDAPRPHEKQDMKYGIVNLECATHDGRHIKVTCSDGKVALLKIGTDGFVAKAVVYGSELAQAGREAVEDEINQLDSGDDRSIIRPGSTKQEPARIRKEPVRLPDIERLLTRTEDAKQVSISMLLPRLARINTA